MDDFARTFVLEAAVGGDENVTAVVGLGYRDGTQQGAPLCISDRYDFVVRFV